MASCNYAFWCLHFFQGKLDCTHHNPNSFPNAAVAGVSIIVFCVYMPSWLQIGYRKKCQAASLGAKVLLEYSESFDVIANK